jgi:hypothetical protein
MHLSLCSFSLFYNRIDQNGTDKITIGWRNNQCNTYFSWNKFLTGNMDENRKNGSDMMKFIRDKYISSFRIV